MRSILYVLPLLLFIIGYIFQYRYPSKINRLYGYRTKRSMSSEKAWLYAQKLLAKTLMIIGLLSFITTIILFNFTSNQVIAIIQVLYIVVVILIIELSLYLKYDKDGKLK